MGSWVHAPYSRLPSPDSRLPTPILTFDAEEANIGESGCACGETAMPGGRVDVAATRMSDRRTAAYAGLILVLLVTACTSTRTPEQTRPVIAPEAVDLGDYRAELEEAARWLHIPPASRREVRFEMEIPQHPSVEAALRYFSGDRRETIQRSFQRSAPWIMMMSEALAANGLPEDLAYLPVIESGYRTSLTSSAGAHGMWQFMPATGREYGLRVDWWVDERADPWKSTIAAASFLKDLYRMFGDWPLALAAYNCGPGRVRRTLREHGATTFWELLEARALPSETRGYVPTFYATIILAAAPERHGFTIPDPSKVNFDEVAVMGPLSLTFLADAVSIDGLQLRELNAHLHRGVVPPGSWPIRVPEGFAPAVAGRAHQWYLEDSLVQVGRYTVRGGDSLEGLSRKLSVGIQDLRSMNGLGTAGSIREGTNLWVPLAQAELSARLHHGGPREAHHVVRPGDTLYSIARDHGITVEDLTDLNQLRSDQIIHPGDRLLLRTSPTATGGM
jgi:membrane-bound lytic murein transglycosylase D